MPPDKSHRLLLPAGANNRPVPPRPYLLQLVPVQLLEPPPLRRVCLLGRLRKALPPQLQLALLLRRVLYRRVGLQEGARQRGMWAA